MMFNPLGIEKNWKQPINVMGERVNVLLKTSLNTKIEENWGFTFQKYNGETYLTSYLEIFGNKFTESQLLIIIKEMSEDSSRIPKNIDFIIGETSCKRAIKFNDQTDRYWC